MLARVWNQMVSQVMNQDEQDVRPKIPSTAASGHGIRLEPAADCSRVISPHATALILTSFERFCEFIAANMYSSVNMARSEKRGLSD
jgi:hypothetical protein